MKASQLYVLYDSLLGGSHDNKIFQSIAEAESKNVFNLEVITLKDYIDRLNKSINYWKKKNFNSNETFKFGPSGE